jgi:hypothetical protein
VEDGGRPLVEAPARDALTLARFARRLLLGALRRARRGVEIVFVDRPRGVPREAAETIWLEDLGLAHEERHSYAPTPWGLLGRLLPPSTVANDDVFADLGCGMGRLLLEAAERYPFRRVVGVELVPRFADAAARRSARCSTSCAGLSSGGRVACGSSTSRPRRWSASPPRLKSR